MMFSAERSTGRALTLAAVALTAAAMLAGCAAPRAYQEGRALLAEGQTEQGLFKLEEAIRLDPRNAEYRIVLAARRSGLVNGSLSAAELARRESRLDDADAAYAAALRVDASNVIARQGREAVAAERRHRRALGEAQALAESGAPDELGLALDKLRAILSEDPQHKAALELKERIDDARARSVQPLGRLSAAFRKPVTLEFRDAPLRAVFDFIAQVSGLNFFFDNDIPPELKATVVAKDTSLEDSLRILLTMNQLEQRVLNQNSILIYPRTPQKLKEYQALSVQTFYLVNADVKAVAATLTTIAKIRDLVVDERLGLVIVRDTPEAIRLAERLVSLQDQSDPEVLLELEVLEVKRSRLMELGINWPGQLSLTPLPSIGQTVTLRDLRNLNSGAIGAAVGATTINLNGEDTSGSILANPRVRVRNREKAKILIGDRVPVITSTATSTGFVAESVTYLEVGLKLEVEPNIYLDDEVAIKVNLEVSSLVREIATENSLAYQVGTRGANTVLRLKDGETQVLAGLINDEDRATTNKIPGLGDLPVVGRLFGSRKDDGQRTELLLSITPRVVRGLRRAAASAAGFESGTEDVAGREPLRLAPKARPQAQSEASPLQATPASAAPR